MNIYYVLMWQSMWPKLWLSFIICPIAIA